MTPGFVLWFTGLSGSGKSTLTAIVAAELRSRGIHVEALDGDEIRKNLSKGLGFSKEDRDTNIRRLGFVANLISRSGGCAITAAISPYRAVRDEVRRGAERFCEVFCDCPLEVLARRDPKGLYDKAMRGEIKNFTGVDDPYEAPERPEVHLHTDRESVAESAGKVIARLEALGFIDTALGARRRGGAEAIEPHGGSLQERLLLGDAAAREQEAARSLPALVIDAEAEGWLAGLATGVLSPLRGFVGEKDYLRISREARLERGLFWPVAPLLRLTEAQVSLVRAASGNVALQGRDGKLLATLTSPELWLRRGPAEEETCLAGEVQVFNLPAWCAGAQRASVVREQLSTRGLSSVVAFASSGPPSLADEYFCRCALELAGGLLLLPGAGPQQGFAMTGLERACAWLARECFAANRVVVAPTAVPAPAVGLQEWLLAIAAQNLGACRLLLPARPAAEAFAASLELSIEVVRYDDAAFSPRLKQWASARSAPDQLVPAQPLTSLEQMAASGRYRPEVLSALR